MVSLPVLPTTKRFGQNLLIGLLWSVPSHNCTYAKPKAPIPAVQSVSECLGCKSSLDDDLAVCANGDGAGVVQTGYAQASERKTNSVSAYILRRRECKLRGTQPFTVVMSFRQMNTRGLD